MEDCASDFRWKTGCFFLILRVCSPHHPGVQWKSGLIIGKVQLTDTSLDPFIGDAEIQILLIVMEVTIYLPREIFKSANRPTVSVATRTSQPGPRDTWKN